MTHKNRIEAIYKGDTPDQVPFMLDLSHWFYHKNKMPWDLSKSYEKPEYELIDYHKKMDVGFYCPNLGLFYKVGYPEDVKIITTKSDDGKEITWTLETPVGSISRTRIWKDVTYAWGIKSWSIKTPEGMKVLAYALENRTFEFMPDKYQAWVDYIGDTGICYVITGYSGMGQILNYWMGIEGTMVLSPQPPEHPDRAPDAQDA